MFGFLARLDRMERRYSELRATMAEDFEILYGLSQQTTKRLELLKNRFQEQSDEMADLYGALRELTESVDKRLTALEQGNTGPTGG